MKSRLVAILFCAALFCTAMAPNSSFAVTPCTGKVNNVFTGDNGNVWVFLDTGVSGAMVPTDPDTKNILAIATAALLAGKTLTLRFQADGLLCNTTTVNRTDIVGAYLNR